jgi:hypothetical protein
VESPTVKLRWGGGGGGGGGGKKEEEEAKNVIRLIFKIKNKTSRTTREHHRV